MVRRYATTYVFILGAALSALAAEKEIPLPKDLPPYGSLKAVTVPHISEKKLPNGMILWLVPRPGFPKVAITLAVGSGLASDPRELPGLSNLLVATLDQGTKTRSAKQIAEELQSAGGDVSGSADSDSTFVSIQVLASKLDPAWAVLADIFRNATFPDGEVDLAKRNAAEGLRAQEAEPSFLARRAMAKALFGEHPYSVISATQDSISKVTAADLRREYARRFRPDQTLLVAVGDFDEARAAAVLERLFGSWTSPSQPPMAPVEPPSQATPHAVFFVPRAGSVQTTLQLGALGPKHADPDFVAAEVANAIYGGMFGSRLINNIREDKGYTYSPFAFIRLLRATGALATRADVRNAVTSATFNEVSYEMNRMATTSPTENEMAHAQRYMVGVRALELQSQESVARQLATLWAQDLPPEELGLESEKIQRVTAQEVEAAGRKYFPASRQTIVAVGDEKVIKDQFAPFALDVKPAPAP